jgi:hypothetical protein
MRSRILTLFTAMTLFIALVVPVGLAAQSADVRKSHDEWTVALLQAAMAAGKFTSEELTREYIARIIALDQNGPGVNSVIELNPDALAIARNADVPLALESGAFSSHNNFPRSRPMVPYQYAVLNPKALIRGR